MDLFFPYRALGVSRYWPAVYLRQTDDAHRGIKLNDASGRS
jgi:hypothetical protein